MAYGLGWRFFVFTQNSKDCVYSLVSPKTKSALTQLSLGTHF